MQEISPKEAKESSTSDSATSAIGSVKKKRGFAVMDRALVSEIARKGGRAAHAAGTAHEFTPEEARAAGRIGGKASHKNRPNPDDKT